MKTEANAVNGMGMLGETIPSAIVVEELLGHLGAARMQMLDTDDKYIREHIHSAPALALVLFRGTRA